MYILIQPAMPFRLRGVDAQDFQQEHRSPAKNLLLLDPSSEFGEFESHTGLKIIRGH